MQCFSKSSGIIIEHSRSTSEFSKDCYSLCFHRDCFAHLCAFILKMGPLKGTKTFWRNGPFPGQRTSRRVAGRCPGKVTETCLMVLLPAHQDTWRLRWMQWGCRLSVPTLKIQSPECSKTQNIVSSSMTS